jgi:RNA polymerase sigma factor (sigma-70 family)
MAAGGSLDDPNRGRPSPEWASVVSACLRKIRRWRVPPRWTFLDWFEEIEAEATVSALNAIKEFDPTRGIPWEAFLRRLIMQRCLTRYRREWTYALRMIAMGEFGEFEISGVGNADERGIIFAQLLDALGRLPPVDSWLIEGLFWGGETEAGLAEVLEISQQAVSKRKSSILRTLRRLIDATPIDENFWL